MHALGTNVRDSITSFTGTITATITYLHGDTQHLVEASSHDGKEIKSEWIRAGRLVTA